MGESIRDRIKQFLDAKGPEADFLEQLLAGNLKALQEVSRRAVAREDWNELDRYAAAVLALGENLQFPKLIQAGRAVQVCIEKRDTGKTSQVVHKTNSILNTIESEKFGHAKSS